MANPCMFATCPNEVAEGAELCPEHLAKALVDATKHPTPLKAAVIGFAATVGTGLAINALYDVIKMIFAHSGNLSLLTRDYLERSERANAACALLKGKSDMTSLEQALVLIETFDAADQAKILRAFQQTATA